MAVGTTVAGIKSIVEGAPGHVNPQDEPPLWAGDPHRKMLYNEQSLSEDGPATSSMLERGCS
jgi:hypothetical protein